MIKNINILEHFFKEPEREFNVREIARLSEINPATASKYLKQLHKERILKHRHERNLDLYKADITSPYYRDLKIYYNVTRIRKSGLIEQLDEFYVRPTIILYGSCAQGYDTESSDIDLVVISENNKEFQPRTKLRTHIFAVKSLKELKNEHLKNSVINGIVLQGELSWT